MAGSKYSPGEGNLPRAFFNVMWGEELKTLHRFLNIISKIHASLTIEQVLRNILVELVSLAGAEAGSLWEVQPGEGKLVLRVVIGEAEEVLRGKSLRIGEGLAGWVARTGEAVIVPDVKKDGRWLSDFDRISNFNTKDMLVIPLKGTEGVIGVVQLINSASPSGFTSEQLRLVELLSGPFSVALENAKLYEKIKRLFKETALALATAIDKRDPYTGGHTKRVVRYVKALAEQLSLSGRDREELEIAAILHDIGKIGIPDSILLKQEQLGEKERKLMEAHVIIGAEILQEVEGFERVVEGIKYHHERWDGSGYPEGLRGEEIPMLARAIAICDVFDALTSARPYKERLSFEKGLEYLMENRGRLFWPEGVDAFLRAWESLKKSK